MTVLLVLTLVYAAILVLALAVGLIAIVYYLNGARSNLKKIATALEQVNRHVEPLNGAIHGVNDGLGGVLSGLKQSRQNLDAGDATPEHRQTQGVEAVR